MYPRIYLAIDNVFAVKRWNDPKEWLSVIRDSGLQHIEASTDNECDPLFTTPEYIADWSNEVLREQKKQELRIVNFHTGYSTYRTIGLAHPDRRIRKRIVDHWFKRMIDLASRFQAGLGLHIHAFLRAHSKILSAMRKQGRSCSTI